MESWMNVFNRYNGKAFVFPLKKRDKWVKLELVFIKIPKKVNFSVELVFFHSTYNVKSFYR